MQSKQRSLFNVSPIARTAHNRKESQADRMDALSVLILDVDRLRTEFVRRSVLAVHSAARCTIVRRISDAASALADPVDLFVTGIQALDGDALDLLSGQDRLARHVFIIVDRCEPRLLASLRSVAPDGVFDSVGDVPENIELALRSILAGRGYWSPSLRACFGDPIGRAILTQLSPTEQLGFAVLGNGCSNTDGAQRLGLARSSVRAMRRNLHAKLGAHGKDDLIRLALTLGYTCASSAGVSALGLEVLAREYRTQSKRPLPLPNSLLGSRRLEHSRSVADPLHPSQPG